MKYIYKIGLVLMVAFALFGTNIATASARPYMPLPCVENCTPEQMMDRSMGGYYGNDNFARKFEERRMMRQDDYQFMMDTFGKFAIVAFAVIFALMLLIIFSNWKIYKKAGRPGWNSIVPIYNYYIMLKYIINRPPWIVLLLFIPYVNWGVYIWMSILLAKRFNKEWTFAIGLMLLPFIFYPILAFGKSKFTPEDKSKNSKSPLNDFANPEPNKTEQQAETVEEIVEVEIVENTTPDTKENDIEKSA